MHFKIENKLAAPDLENLANALQDEQVESIELLPEFECVSIQVSQLIISARDGYSLTVNLDFHDPIGTTVCSNLRIKEYGLTKSPRTIEMDIRKAKIDPEELDGSIKYSLSLVEKIVNYACKIRNEKVYDVFVVDFELISRQLSRIKAERERTLRGEKVRAFGLVHADGGRELKALSNDLIPFYEEFDRWDLYGGKKVYRLLPRDFVVKLLKCQGDALISEDQFDEREKEVLCDLAKRRQIKRRKIAGRVYYFNLDDRTKRYLINALGKRSF